MKKKCMKRMSGGPVPSASGFAKGGPVGSGRMSTNAPTREQAMKIQGMPRAAAMRCEGRMKTSPFHKKQHLATGGVAKMRNDQYY